MVEPYGQLVQIGDTPEGFVISCEEILQRSREEQLAHSRALAEVVARTSWDSTAQAMVELIVQADEAVGGATEVAQPRPGVSDSAPLHLTDAAQAVSVVTPRAKRASAAG